MNNINERIRTHIDVIAPPVTLDEAVERDGYPIAVTPLNAHRRAARPSLITIAAAAAIIVVGAGAIALRQTSNSVSVGSTPPLPSGLPTTGVVFSPDDTLALAMSNEVLVSDCMAEKGWEYQLPTSDELIALHGQWFPHPVLGIQAAGAARRVGYHPAPGSGLGSASQIAALSPMESDDREAFLEDLAGSSTPSPSDGTTAARGCWSEVLRTTVNPDERHRAEVNRAADLGELAPSGSGFDDVAPNDERVREALSAWSACVETATGERADTPNDLARSFLDGNYEGTATAEEIAVATADAECQQRTNLWTVWYTVVAELTRQRLGDNVGVYDNWTRARVEMVQTARATLAARGIEPPSLD